ncbi:hypothetical protein ERJ75_001713100 [Trypanosoma vivax]|nr:hypothetical protein ERJ75_001713100 [Trypanosoma vivax]
MYAKRADALAGNAPRATGHSAHNRKTAATAEYAYAVTQVTRPEKLACELKAEAMQTVSNVRLGACVSAIGSVDGRDRKARLLCTDVACKEGQPEEPHSCECARKETRDAPSGKHATRFGPRETAGELQRQTQKSVNTEAVTSSKTLRKKIMAKRGTDDTEQRGGGGRLFRPSMRFGG